MLLSIHSFSVLITNQPSSEDMLDAATFSVTLACRSRMVTSMPILREQGATAAVPPDVGGITPYDRAHFALYIALLDCDAAGGGWCDAAIHAFGIDPDAEPTSAMLLYEANLARARWFSQEGYRLLLASED